VVPLKGAETLHDLIRGSHIHRLDGLTHGLFYYQEARVVARDVIEQTAAAATPRKHGWAPHAL
jgi:hypothetical protein